MGAWRLEFTTVAESDLAKLDRSLRRQVIDRLDWLTENFENIMPIPLHAAWKGYYKLRVGDWRVAYSFSLPRETIRVGMIDHRTKIYKRRP